MMKLELRAARVRVEMDFTLEGSVLRGTVKAACREMRTYFDLESDEPEEKLRLLVRNSRGGCFAETTVRNAVPVSSTCTLNGNLMEV